VPPAEPERIAHEERGDRLVSLVPRPVRRHRPRRVLGQQRDHRRHVRATQGLHVALDDRRHRLVAEGTLYVPLAGHRQPAVHTSAGALQRAVDGRGGGAEQRRRVPGREAEHIPHQQHRPLVRRQVLQRGDERQLDALVLVVAASGPA
jgi:hypothetical protein